MQQSIGSRQLPQRDTVSSSNRFLVCGLGGLGQYCAATLKEFGVVVSVISEVYPTDWEVPNLPDRLDQVYIGDYRHSQVLQNANIQDCRAILLVASDEQTNIEAAFSARLLNPNIRLVLRSSKQNLNQLLSENLGNFVAFEPNQLAVSPFALAALSGETQAFFNLEDQLLRVVKRHVQPDSAWYHKRLDDLQGPNRRILSSTVSSSGSSTFYGWDPKHHAELEEWITYAQIVSKSDAISPMAEPSLVSLPTTRGPRNFTLISIWKRGLHILSWAGLRQTIYKLWRSTEHHQSQRMLLVCSVTVFILATWGTLFYRFHYPEINFQDALHATASLLLGGYGDVFGGVEVDVRVPRWLQWFSLAMALTGTAFVGIIYALITENLLSARLQFLARRPPIPKQDHVILVGLEGLSEHIAGFLLNLKQPLVGISSTQPAFNVLPSLPIVVGEGAEVLSLANLARAKSVIVATEDEMANLETGLMAHAANPAAALVIRMFDQRFSETLGKLLPYAKVLCTHALAAEAFAAAAFGENILGLFRLDDQTILITEYTIAPHDTLHRLLVSEVAYGFDTVPILHVKCSPLERKWMPSDDVRLEVGDRLIVMSTLASLQQIEQGEIAPRQWQVHIDQALNQSARFEGVTVISLVCGCARGVAQQVMENLPSVVPLLLYKHQAHRLVHKLAQVQVRAWAEVQGDIVTSI
jgi:Trk K+ transport system NAD-binding subunit